MRPGRGGVRGLEPGELREPTGLRPRRGGVGGRRRQDVRLWARGTGARPREWPAGLASTQAQFTRRGLADVGDAGPCKASNCRLHVGCSAGAALGGKAGSAEAEDKMGAGPPLPSVPGARAAGLPHVAHAPPRISGS